MNAIVILDISFLTELNSCIGIIIEIFQKNYYE